MRIFLSRKNSFLLLGRSYNLQLLPKLFLLLPKIIFSVLANTSILLKEKRLFFSFPKVEIGYVFYFSLDLFILYFVKFLPFPLLILFCVFCPGFCLDFRNFFKRQLLVDFFPNHRMGRCLSYQKLFTNSQGTPFPDFYKLTFGSLVHVSKKKPL